MKNLTKALLALFTVAFSISFTSCLDSKDNDDAGSLIQPGTEEYTSYLIATAGTYSGKMYFYDESKEITNENKSKVDSVDIAVSVQGIRDSLIYTNIPANYLLLNLKNNDELIQDMGSRPISISMKYYLYQISNDILYFGVYPLEANVPFTNTSGNHEVTFEFVNNINFWGAYRKGAMQLQLILSKIKLDGKVLKQFSQEEMRTSAVYLLNLNKDW